jgi:acetyltransferase-like isoleucine patch superfamily enzyme
MTKLLRMRISGMMARFRSLYFYAFFKRSDVMILGRVKLMGFVFGPRIFSKGLKIYPNCIFEIGPDMNFLSIGQNCTFSYGVVLSISNVLEIGDNVWVGEYSSIRDSTHNFSIFHPIGYSSDKSSPIKIGSNVWIGRGCIILPGTEIGDNVIIGANSVISGNLQSNSLYAGSPAVLKRILST